MPKDLALDDFYLNLEVRKSVSKTDDFGNCIFEVEASNENVDLQNQIVLQFQLIRECGQSAVHSSQSAARGEGSDIWQIFLKTTISCLYLIFAEKNGKPILIIDCPMPLPNRIQAYAIHFCINSVILRIHLILCILTKLMLMPFLIVLLFTIPHYPILGPSGPKQSSAGGRGIRSHILCRRCLLSFSYHICHKEDLNIEHFCILFEGGIISYHIARSFLHFAPGGRICWHGCRRHASVPVSACRISSGLIIFISLNLRSLS